MKQIIIVFERPDLDAAGQLRAQLPDAEIWVFDPHLLDNLREQGLGNHRYVDVPLAFDIPAHSAEVLERTLATERRLDELLAEWLPEAAGCHWQHLNLFFLTAALIQYSALWDRFAGSLEDAELHVPLRDQAGMYYTPSFLPAVLLLERLSARQRRFSAYSHSKTPPLPQNIPKLAGSGYGERAYDGFVHLPTCIYDRGFFEQELVASGKSLLNFSSNHWNVPLPALETVPLGTAYEAMLTLPQPVQEQIEHTVSAIGQTLAEVFGEFLRTGDFITRQASHVAEQCRAQMVFFLSLDRCFAQHPPRRLFLSNHDSGLHGPFLSFARKHRVPVVFLPHAKVFNFPVASSCDDVLALTHPVQGGEILNLAGKRVRSQAMLFPEQHRRDTGGPQRLESVGIVLNKFSGDGISLVDTRTYVEGLRAIIEWCDRHAVTWKLRLKPGGTCVTWLAAELGIDAAVLLRYLTGPIADFVSQCDICLLYDTPTSGAIDSLRQAVATVNTTIRALSSDEENVVDAGIVPRESLPQTLRRLDRYHGDGNCLAIFRNQQFASYMARFGQALPLRLFL